MSKWSLKWIWLVSSCDSIFLRYFRNIYIIISNIQFDSFNQRLSTFLFILPRLKLAWKIRIDSIHYNEIIVHGWQKILENITSGSGHHKWWPEPRIIFFNIFGQPCTINIHKEAVKWPQFKNIDFFENFHLPCNIG